ncbi:hypothetical protein, partial [Amycolatopsis rubida]|uniref:hypothetical protein n=1 Tax=Amycolatopsis rubida TaxID=112413 RepID=UPI00194172C8
DADRCKDGSPGDREPGTGPRSAARAVPCHRCGRAPYDGNHSAAAGAGCQSVSAAHRGPQ